MKRSLFLFPLLVAASASASDMKPETATGEALVDGNGAFKVPADYRVRYQALGAWAVAAEKGSGAKQMHVVYASPGVADAWRQTGSFPDGAVLVKEVYDTATEPMTTGTVSHASALKGWFVMIRDAKNEHPGNKLWGEGWGWSWFEAGKPSVSASTDYRTDCLGCHEPARKTSYVYVEGYPALR